MISYTEIFKIYRVEMSIYNSDKKYFLLHQIKEELQILSNVTPTFYEFYEKDGFESIWNLINIEIARKERPNSQKNIQNREKVLNLIKSKKVTIFRKGKGKYNKIRIDKILSNKFLINRHFVNCPISENWS